MEVRAGWSGEGPDGKWNKVDITASEVDLERHCRKTGIDMETLSGADVFAKLNLMAETYLCIKLCQLGVMTQEQARARINTAKSH